MDYIDYYKILGVGKKATDKEIKSAFRKLARKFHPDVNPGDNEAEKKFKELNEANEVLSDPDKRKKYDKYGKDWKHAEQFEKAEQQQSAYGQQGGRQSYASGGGSAFEGDFSDFFSSMFGGGGEFSRGQARSHSLKGQDLTAELHLPLRQAASTHKQTITVNSKKIRITIPAGIGDGQTIKIKGQGGPGMQGGPKGDLFITFRLDKDPVFERKGDHLYIKQKVDLYTLVLGGELEVETLHGKVKIKVKPGTDPGSKIRLKNKGFPLYKNAHQHGDLYVTLEADIPRDLSKKEKELFEELKNLRK